MDGRADEIALQLQIRYRSLHPGRALAHLIFFRLTCDHYIKRGRAKMGRKHTVLLCVFGCYTEVMTIEVTLCNILLHLLKPIVRYFGQNQSKGAVKRIILITILSQLTDN